MKRIEHDYYPTPPDAVEALRVALLAPPMRTLCDKNGDWLDPAAGAGTLLEWLGVRRERRHAIELRTDAAPFLAERIDQERTIVGVDALTVPWPEADIVANPPFKLLDAFVRRIILEQDAAKYNRLAAVLMPTQWLQAQGRADIRAPAFFWPLRWRPSFRGEGGGAAHDVAWVVWSKAWPYNTWAQWLPRPVVPQEHMDTFRRILGLPVSGHLELKDSHASS